VTLSNANSYAPPGIAKWFAIVAMLISSPSCAQADAGLEESAENTVHTVLITGANRGIGLELARQYAAAGWQVIGTARRPDGAKELRALNAEVMQLDVTDPESVARLAGDLGERPIDMLINNAGILEMMATIDEIDFDVVNRTLAVNTVGPMRVTSALMPNLRQGGLKKIINITSNLGSIETNDGGRFYGYRESKAALNMFTKTIAVELRAEGFICIVMHPGWVQTDMGGSSAPVTVEDSASGIRNVVDTLEPNDSGTYWTHLGEQMPW
jgi:NAD(P)-dependent dehydrogenase (short-subunit alcohol dehydrogenase family)